MPVDLLAVDSAFLESNHLFDGSAHHPVRGTSRPFEAIKVRFFWCGDDVVSPKFHIFDIVLCQILRITTLQAMQLQARRILISPVIPALAVGPIKIPADPPAGNPPADPPAGNPPAAPPAARRAPIPVAAEVRRAIASNR